MTCVKQGCADPCFYCDAEVQRHDHDHAPIPRRAGGTQTVVACPGCHNLKDRILFARWPLTLAVMAVRELVELGETPDASVTDWPVRWDDMTSHGRLLWAKWAATATGGVDMEVRHARRADMSFGVSLDGARSVRHSPCCDRDRRTPHPRGTRLPRRQRGPLGVHRGPPPRRGLLCAGCRGRIQQHERRGHHLPGMGAPLLPEGRGRCRMTHSPPLPDQAQRGEDGMSAAELTTRPASPPEDSRIAGHVVTCHTQLANDDWVCSCPPAQAAPAPPLSDRQPEPGPSTSPGASA